MLFIVCLYEGQAQTGNTPYPNQDKNGINQNPAGTIQNPDGSNQNPNTINSNGTQPNINSSNPNVTNVNPNGVNSNGTSPNPNNTSPSINGNQNPNTVKPNPGGTTANPATDPNQKGINQTPVAGTPNATTPYVNGAWWDYGNQTKLSATDVPSSINRIYMEKYPNQANAIWYRGQNGYMVTYPDKNKMDEQVMFDNSGKILGTGVQVSNPTLPTQVSTYLTKEYSGKSAEKVYKLSTSDGNTVYQVLMNGKWMTFSSDGKLIPAR